MHPLHDDIARLLGEHVRTRSVVVWYDPRAEFMPFVDELRGRAAEGASAASVVLVGCGASFVQFNGSMFELRAVIEALVSGEAADALVVYLPGCRRDAGGSVLMEVEKAGDVWEPQLKQLARNVLLRRYTEGDVDTLLASDAVTYADMAAAAADGGGEGPSLLKGIFRDSAGGDAILAAWLASDARDDEIGAKEAGRELVRLILSRLGLEVAEGSSLAKMRAATLRYVLGGEFRSDLAGPPPPSLDAIPVTRTKSDETAIREMASRLRTSHPGAYAEIADQVEAELRLGEVSFTAESLGSIDTFRFEERVVFDRCASLIAERRWEEALVHVKARNDSFWLNHDPARRMQWEACLRMADLGQIAESVHAEIAAANGDAGAWVKRYSDADGWLRLDQAQRRLEMLVSSLDDDPPEQAIAVVRRVYEDAIQSMAVGFTKALAKTQWSVLDVLQQTQVYTRVLAEQPKPVAYFLVDALRYEMGLELVGRLPASAEVRIRPAVASLPSITPIGMAALQPGADASFDVVSENGKLGARIDGVFLPDMTARRKFAASRIPGVVEVTLGDILTWSKSKLAAQVAGHEVVIVRSTEIDNAGEGGFAHQARQIMDSVIDDLARAIRRLGDAGFERSVVTADHGYLFAHGDREESMRVEAPGGEKVEIHRRCWIGRGGATPMGCLRVTAADLGYASDLEFVFPRGVGVFRAGGDLGYHHGGASLQEMVIPVASVRMAPAAVPESSKEKLTVSNLPYEITTRVFSVDLELGGPNLAFFSTTTVIKPVLLSGSTQVGSVGVAIGGDVDMAAGTVAVQPGKVATIVFLLSGENVDAVRIVIRDPTTDAELYRSPADIPVRLGVG